MNFMVTFQSCSQHGVNQKHTQLWKIKGKINCSETPIFLSKKTTRSRLRRPGNAKKRLEGS